MSARPVAPGSADGRVGATLGALRTEIDRIGPVVVAFSGGADSALLGWVATDVLGPGAVLCVTAVSASLAPEELTDCRALADEWGLRWRTVTTDELDDPEYVANGGDRCYHCKASLLSALAPLAVAESAAVVLGVNLDDLGDHRPGQRAAAERGRASPSSTPASPRTTCGPCRGIWACAPGTSPPRRAWPRASPTARR